MQALPVVVGFGGYSAAGRSSFHQAYRRMIFESLATAEQQKTLVGLACLMKLVTHDEGVYLTAEGNQLTASQVAETYEAQILESTLVRRIENNHFDVDNTPWQPSLDVKPSDDTLIEFVVKKRQLPAQLPEGWQVEAISDKKCKVTLPESQKFFFQGVREFPVKAAGQLPTGFEPSEHYNARFQPRGLQLAILGVSDAIRSMGIPWDDVMAHVQPDQVGVYASSIFGQTGSEGLGGLFKSRSEGGRPTAKQLPLGLNGMAADFVNAYVLGSIGHTEAVTGACATFLYNLRSALSDIKHGLRRIAIVGDAEAAVNPELMEGFANMGALASDEGLSKLDGVATPDWRRASRPFGENCGFTIGESSQYIILMEDALAVELGADILGAATDVFVNADGIKKSISGPGAGNLICFTKAVAAAQAIVGQDLLANNSVVMAHGSGTPQNRVTESIIFERVAETFGIKNWPVSAVKAYLGHTMAPASGDAFITSLGVFKEGILPGIKTINQVADDVYQDNLNFPLEDLDLSKKGVDVSFINSKGFGGNNATGVLLSPRLAEAMLSKRYGEQWHSYCEKREQVRQVAKQYEAAADHAELNPFYRFGEPTIAEDNIELATDQIKVPGYENPITLPSENPYADLI